MSPIKKRTKVEWVPDLVKYRELRWLDDNHYVAHTVAAVLSVIPSRYVRREIGRIFGY